ncbi:iron-sulfur cluster assembly scaffold protein [uncultured Gimesia sp.]|uniref:iron-sulfur cluster assembly scaffold protein n=1 Tax=uncultured Gimesia sp. TaxID=1678688 RepID=UPI0026072A6C|nr:iron-sulfur cluster assembly scaffold protein [uncultured Gimesia sp.]
MSRFSEIVLDHAVRPRNWGKLDSPERVGVSGVPGQGKYLVFYLMTDGKKITKVGFQCHGCGATIAAGSVLAEMVVGLQISECLSITGEQLLTALGGLPADKRHAAGFALKALQGALTSTT